MVTGTIPLSTTEDGLRNDGHSASHRPRIAPRQVHPADGGRLTSFRVGNHKL